jgi:hypothetical protein
VEQPQGDCNALCVRQWRGCAVPEPAVALGAAQGYAENAYFGCDCGAAAITTKITSFVVVRRQAHRVLLQSPELRSANGKNISFWRLCRQKLIFFLTGAAAPRPMPP